MIQSETFFNQSKAENIRKENIYPDIVEISVKSNVYQFYCSSI